MGAAEALEEDVVLPCELSNVLEELAPCMTGCGRFWGNDRVPLLPLAIPFPFGLHELYLPLPFGMPFRRPGFTFKRFAFAFALAFTFGFPFAVRRVDEGGC